MKNKKAVVEKREDLWYRVYRGLQNQGDCIASAVADTMKDLRESAPIEGAMEDAHIDDDTWENIINTIKQMGPWGVCAAKELQGKPARAKAKIKKSELPEACRGCGVSTRRPGSGTCAGYGAFGCGLYLEQHPETKFKAESKNSPGPWTLQDEGQTGDKFVYCDVVTGDDEVCHIIQSKRARANAALIAGAPDLLAALIWAAENIENIAIPEMDKQGRVTSLNNALKRARAAIAKATGGK